MDSKWDIQAIETEGDDAKVQETSASEVASAFGDKSKRELLSLDEFDEAMASYSNVEMVGGTNTTEMTEMKDRGSEGEFDRNSYYGAGDEIDDTTSKWRQLVADLKETTDEESVELSGEPDVLWKSTGMFKDYSFFHMALIYTLIIGTFGFLGVWWFVHFEDYSILDGIFLVVIIFTTVGYGVEYPLQQKTYVFMIFYIVLGVAIIGGCVCALMGSASNSLYKEKKKKFKYMKEMGTVRSSQDTFLEGDFGDDGRWDAVLENIFSKWGIFISWMFATLLLGFLIFAIEDWTLAECIYFAFVSGSSVGFGDLTPETIEGRWLMIFYLPVLIVLTAAAFSQLFIESLSPFLNEDQQKLSTFRDDQLAKLLNSDNFDERFAMLDIDNDGKLTEKEFILQVLINFSEIPDSFVEEIRKKYRELDIMKDGVLDKKDVQKWSKRRIGTTVNLEDGKKIKRKNVSAI